MTDPTRGIRPAVCATAVTELNTDGPNRVGWLSPDGCAVWINSDGTGGIDIFTATRGP